MTDDIEPTEEDRLRDEARATIATPPEPIPDAQGLNPDVRDGHIEDAP
jgi:hypothetical protein